MGEMKRPQSKFNYVRRPNNWDSQGGDNIALRMVGKVKENCELAEVRGQVHLPKVLTKVPVGSASGALTPQIAVLQDERKWLVMLSGYQQSAFRLREIWSGLKPITGTKLTYRHTQCVRCGTCQTCPISSPRGTFVCAQWFGL